MKKIKQVIFKKQLKKSHLKLPLLGFLIALLIVAVVGKQLSPFKKHIALPKALATHEKPLMSLLVTPTATPASSLLLTTDKLLTATPTATPTPKTVQVAQTQSGFCLNAPMLMYHHIQPLAEANKLGHAQLTVDNGIFDQQIAYLVSHGYTTVSSDQVVAALLSHQQLPAKSIVITLDDGYDDTYNYAFAIAKKYNINLDLMIPSGLMNNPGYMTWGQLKEMTSNSLIHVYDHTWSHASLGGATKDKIEFEVTTSQTQLQSQLGKISNVFVYPYGTFSPLAISILQGHGFIAGISTLPGTEQCDSYIMTLHRTRIGNAPLSSYGF